MELLVLLSALFLCSFKILNFMLGIVFMVKIVCRKNDAGQISKKSYKKEVL